MREIFEGAGAELEVAGDATDDGVEKLARLHREKILHGNLGARDELFVSDLQAALGFGDDVIKIIFEREAGHGG